NSRQGEKNPNRKSPQGTDLFKSARQHQSSGQATVKEECTTGCAKGRLYSVNKAKELAITGHRIEHARTRQEVDVKRAQRGKDHDNGEPSGAVWSCNPYCSIG